MYEYIYDCGNYRVLCVHLFIYIVDVASRISHTSIYIYGMEYIPMQMIQNEFIHAELIK